jgi:mRNA-degrading endonuclease YafQ of YafQ-DinJ toxin-antitoxin module
MRFTLGRVMHFYYVFVLLAMTGLFVYGAKYYWDSGLLNIEYVSNLYDGTSKVKAVKERNDIDEIKKFVDGDRIKDANKIFTRLQDDIHDLKSIKPVNDKSSFEENQKKVKAELVNFQSAPELTTILNNVTAKVTTFENFVTEKKWPTLTKMAMNLRIKTSPGRLMQGGLYNFEKTQNLAMSVNNDIEAMTNFTESSGLPADIKVAILNRIKTIKSDSSLLDSYVEDHKKFNRAYKDFAVDYQAWFKFVEPEIALKKIQFEKSSQTILYSLIIVFASFAMSIALGFVIYNWSGKRASQKTEKLILDSIKDGLIPIETKRTDRLSSEFEAELDKYHDYVHKRMSFGSIFQEAMPFASILLDSNLNLVWGNAHFYEQWKLQNFNEEGGDLTWDFLQRFTDLEDNSSVLSALRMSTSGVYNIQVRNGTGSNPIPFEMHVSPVEYSSQKRIMIIFYPTSEVQSKISAQRSAIINPMVALMSAQLNETITTDIKSSLRSQIEKAGGSELYTKFNQYVEKNESTRDDLSGEIERLETTLSEQRNIVSEMRKSLVASFETQRAQVAKYNQFKASVTAVLDARDQLEEQFRFVINSSRDFYKDQNKIFTTAEKAEKSVDEYVRSLKTITNLKGEFKELKGNVEEFKSRITQVLDQLLIFQNHEDDTLRVDQFLGKIKLEMKGFEKVLNNFNEVVTQLDVTVTKMDMMVESREKVDLESIKGRLDSIKNNLDNANFSSSKITTSAHSRDEEMVVVLKSLVQNLKSEMKRIDEMCRLTGLTAEHLKVISPEQPAESV